MVRSLGTSWVRPPREADTEGQLQTLKDEKRAAKKELMAVEKYLSSLHAECDWLVRYYDVRKEAPIPASPANHVSAHPCSRHSTDTVECYGLCVRWGQMSRSSAFSTTGVVVKRVSERCFAKWHLDELSFDNLLDDHNRGQLGQRLGT